MSNEYDDEYATCEKTYASLRIMNDNLDPQEVTRQLGIQPTWAWRKGEPRGERKGFSRVGIWGLSTEFMQSRDTRRHLDWLIVQMDGKEEYIRQLQSQGYRMDIYCYWVSNGQGGPTVSPKNIKGLAQLGIELGFSFWIGGDAETDEQSNEK